MIYPYRCQSCQASFEVIKPYKDISRLEACSSCGSEHTERTVSIPSLMGISIEDAAYDPAFGCVIQNRSHRKRLAKEKGLIEVGNESPELIHKTFDNDREKKIQRGYDNITSDLLSLGSIKS